MPAATSRAGVIDVKNSTSRPPTRWRHGCDPRDRCTSRAAHARPGLRLQPDRPLGATAKLGHSSRAATSSAAARGYPARSPGGNPAMQAHHITMLGTGLIGDFYTATLHGQRAATTSGRLLEVGATPDGVQPSARTIAEQTTDLEAAIERPSTDVVVVGLPNYLHEEAVGWRRCRQGGPVHETARPDGGRGPRGCSGGPRRPASSEGIRGPSATRRRPSRRSRAVQGGAIGGDVTWVRSRETHPGAAQRVVLGRPADRRRRDHRPAAATASRSSGASSGGRIGGSR